MIVYLHVQNKSQFATINSIQIHLANMIQSLKWLYETELKYNSVKRFNIDKIDTINQDIRTHEVNN